MSDFCPLHHPYATRFHTLASHKNNACAARTRDLAHLTKQLSIDYHYIFSRREHPLPPLNKKFMDALLQQSEYHDLATFMRQLPGGDKWLVQSSAKTLAALKGSFKDFLAHNSQVAKLENLTLSNLFIQALPEEILSLTHLRKLEVFDCPRFRGICFTGRWEVVHLNFSHCLATSFSEDLSLPHLFSLSIQNNRSHHSQKAREQLTFKNFLRCEKENLPTSQQAPNLVELFIHEEALNLQQQAQKLAKDFANRENSPFMWPDEEWDSEEDSLGSYDPDDPDSYRYLN